MEFICIYVGLLQFVINHAIINKIFLRPLADAKNELHLVDNQKIHLQNINININ